MVRSLRSGTITITLQHLRTTDRGRDHWQYSVAHNGTEIAAGDQLETYSWQDRDAYHHAANELLNFLWLTDSEIRAEHGWTFDPDVLYSACVTQDTDTETVFLFTEEG